MQQIDELKRLKAEKAIKTSDIIQDDMSPEQKETIVKEKMEIIQGRKDIQEMTEKYNKLEIDIKSEDNKDTKNQFRKDRKVLKSKMTILKKRLDVKMKNSGNLVSEDELIKMKKLADVVGYKFPEKPTIEEFERHRSILQMKARENLNSTGTLASSAYLMIYSMADGAGLTGSYAKAVKYKSEFEKSFNRMAVEQAGKGRDIGKFLSPTYMTIGMGLLPAAETFLAYAISEAKVKTEENKKKLEKMKDTPIVIEGSKIQ